MVGECSPVVNGRGRQAALPKSQAPVGFEGDEGWGDVLTSLPS